MRNAIAFVRRLAREFEDLAIASERAPAPRMRRLRHECAPSCERNVAIIAHSMLERNLFYSTHIWYERRGVAQSDCVTCVSLSLSRRIAIILLDVPRQAPAYTTARCHLVR